MVFPTPIVTSTYVSMYVLLVLLIDFGWCDSHGHQRRSFLASAELFSLAFQSRMFKRFTWGLMPIGRTRYRL